MKFLLKRCTALSFLTCIHLQVCAGTQDGPFVIWLNLSENKAIDSLVHDQLDRRENCSEPRMVISAPPQSISTELTRKAMLRADKRAIRSLDRLMRLPVKGLAHEGFNGIIVYDEINGPRLSSLARGWTSVAREKIAQPHNIENQWKAFCISVPEISRLL
jgi:hypothetical protein